MLKDTPPIEGKMRFGNIAFKDFHSKMNEVNHKFALEILKHFGQEEKYAIELETYLNDCYGDESRIDYGTGHELNFMVFLYCLNKLQPFKENEYAALIH